MATYGNLPGVKITTGPGNLTQVVIGRDQYLYHIGVGNSNTTASPNEVIDVETAQQVENEFGADSDLGRAFKRANNSGAVHEFMRGVVAETLSDSTTTSSSSGNVPSPIVPDTENSIDVHKDGDPSNSVPVELKYGSSPPNGPDDDAAVSINPRTGEFVTGSSTPSSIVINTESIDWDSALQAAADSLVEGDFAIISPLTANEDVAQTLDDKITEDTNDNPRDHFAMALGVCAAEPNATANNTYPKIDASSYSTSLDTDRIFLVGPTRFASAEPNNAEFGVGLLGHVAGRIAGTPVGDPIYNDVIETDRNMAQTLSRGDVTLLRNERIIPIKDDGIIRMEDNQSTFDGTQGEDWPRDLFRKQVVDLTIVSMFQIARDFTQNTILDQDVPDEVALEIRSQIDDFIARDLLRTGGNNFNVFTKDSETIGIEASITPNGVAKSAEVDITVNSP